MKSYLFVRLSLTGQVHEIPITSHMFILNTWNSLPQIIYFNFHIKVSRKWLFYDENFPKNLIENKYIEIV